MQKMIKSSLFLVVILMISAAALTVVNRLTDPVIQENKVATVRGDLQKVFPGVSEFREVSFTDNTGKVIKAYEAVGSGYAFEVQVDGYADVIKFMIGIKNDGSYSGFLVQQLNDTPGFGTKIAESEFISQVTSKSVSDKIDTISGVTRTSSAVVSGIEAAKAVYEGLK